MIQTLVRHSFSRSWSDCQPRVLIVVLTLACGGIVNQVESLQAQTADQLRRQAEQHMGRPISEAEVLQRLQQSGLSPADVRRELERRGLDRAAADAYLDVLEGRATRVPEGTDPVPLLEVVLAREASRESEVGIGSARREAAPDVGQPIFGRELFRRASSEFQPIMTGPVPPDYRVGPGDELTLILTGGVEQAYQVTVSREGWVVIPDVGRVNVQGRTLEGVQQTFFQRLSQVYSGIRRGADATTFFDVTLGRLRTNQVFVIGEVERPSAYTVSGLATALTALYQAGGPTRAGSFRRVLINRGGETIAEIDLYEYLTEGLAPSDLRLQHGDIVFVPPSRSRIEVSGPVVRPGIYELLEGEDLRSLLRYSGGLQPRAEIRRVQVQRVLRPDERTAGSDRAVLDVPLGTLEAGPGEPIPVRDGDRVTVFAVLEDSRNEINVSGGVWRPGLYGADESTRLWDVIDRAGGLLPDVVQGRAQIQRLRPDWTRELIPVSLARDAEGMPLENPVLEGMDEILIFASRDLRDDRAVSIGGWVREPGVYPYIRGMTIADLILQAGGLRAGAFIAGADVSRVLVRQDRTSDLAEQIQVPLDSVLVFDEGNPGNPPRISDSEAGRFMLQNLDAVYIRKAPGFDPQSAVVVEGEVLFPGPYSLETRSERLVDLLQRSGGTTDEAYLQGLQLWRVQEEGRDAGIDRADGIGILQEQARREDERMGRIGRDSTVNVGAEEGESRDSPRAREPEQLRRTRVGIDARAALNDPGSRHNVLIQANDSIFVPAFIPTVDVRGAVASPTKVLHVPGKGLQYYIEQAGGYLRTADESGTRVQYASGDVEVRGRRFLGIGGGVTRPDPGATITVREVPEDQRTSFSEAVSIVSATVGTIATIALLISRF